ncbi:hypothetical protein TrLO_g11142 [Triparma laevis f. longispina]|uniref:Metallo-beta-lactamase domain-containing protein n=2 Tax=Triparma laevis TaxID=1534972 RepID=A0A9W7ADL8_9STRA|nr:hypothetical protein TrLO_g11142 [Triparma laevis f. longispina]
MRVGELRELATEKGFSQSAKGLKKKPTSMPNPNFTTPPLTPSQERAIRLSHPVLSSLPPSDLDVVFLGTASCSPSITRGVSCTALRLNWRSGGIWLFDCGESTQLQLQKSPDVKPGKVNKIFLTHSHGDHTFGLPGLLCLIGQDRDKGAEPLDIYGPEGLREWLRVTVRWSCSRICPNYRVHELKGLPMAPGWRRLHNGGYRYSPIPHSERVYQKNDSREIKDDLQSYVNYVSKTPPLESNPNYGEVPGGLDIEPNWSHPESSRNAPVWDLITDEDEGDMRVSASVMSHGVPCIGYVCKEVDRPGRLRSEIAMPVLERNIGAMKEQGIRDPMKVMGFLKTLPKGEVFEFPDGTVLKSEDIVEEERKGRKVVICGDTCDAGALEKLAEGADLLVHEATNSYLKGIDTGTSYREVQMETIKHGHSTPQMAAEFAKTIGAKKLALNHFSPRYKGDCSDDSLRISRRIERQAIEHAGELGAEDVVAAWDFMVLPIPTGKGVVSGVGVEADNENN